MDRPSFPARSHFPKPSISFPHGVLGGGQVGYNWQAASNWVVGVEADLQASAQTNSTTCVTRCITGLFPRLHAGLAKASLVRHGARAAWLGYRLGALLSHRRLGLRPSDHEHCSQCRPRERQFPQLPPQHIRLDAWRRHRGAVARETGPRKHRIPLRRSRSRGEFLCLRFSSNDQLPGIDAIRNHVARVGLNYRFGGPGVVVARY